MTSAREQILQTTCDLLESQGYHATGLNQIVKESGAPKGSLYYYFPAGKEAIAAEAIESMAELVSGRIRANLAGSLPAGTALRQFCETIAQHVEESGFRAGGPLTTVALETATTNDSLNQACRSAYEQLRGAFAENLAVSGRTAEEAESLSFMILATMEGAILLSRTYHSGDPLRQAGVHLETLINL